MSVYAMLALLWWGLLGFISILGTAYFFFQSLGPKGRLVVILLVGTACGHLLDRHFAADERCANGFLSAWAAESADFPKGRAYTTPWGAYADYERLGSVNPYLAQHLRMRYRSPVRPAGREDVQTAGQSSPVPSKVYVADACVFSSELDREFRARVRLWVARDNHRITKFQFEDIDIQ